LSLLSIGYIRGLGRGHGYHDHGRDYGIHGHGHNRAHGYGDTQLIPLQQSTLELFSFITLPFLPLTIPGNRRFACQSADQPENAKYNEKDGNDITQ
jgi:hypothetical protein